MQYNLPTKVINTLLTLQKSDYQAYIVGGAIRDLLTNKSVYDWDFTTDATPDQIKKLFPKSFYDNSFGTVGIPIPIKNKKDKYEIYEITTFRTETNYQDKRHPQKVSWGKSLDQDLQRRDFTINAMAAKLTDNKLKIDKKEKDNPPKKVTLTIIDPHAGQYDLQNKLVKTVGNPNKRFTEDALRMIRAIRIATQLGFTIDQQTFLAISKNAQSITHISAERVRDELIKILKSDHPADGLMLLKNSLLLSHIIPELEEGYGLEQKGHHIYDVFTHSIKSLQFCPSDKWLVRFATLIHDIAKPQVVKGEGEDKTFHNHEVTGAFLAKDIAKRLKFTKDDTQRLFILVRWHMFSVSEFLSDAAIRRFIKRVGKENIEDIINIRIGDRLGGGCKTETSWRLKKFLKRVQEVQKHTPSVHDLKVSGYDVMKILNIPPSKKVGEVMEQLFDQILEDPKNNTKKNLLKKIEEFKKSPPPSSNN